MNIVFAGTPAFAVPALDALHEAGHRITAVYTQPDRPAGRGRQLRFGPVKERALALGLPVVQPTTLRDSGAVRVLASHAPDVMVVAAYGLLLPPEILAIPRHGCVNVHASLLPRWRGAAPIQRAILAGDDVTGVAIMRMEAGLDTGPVYAERSVHIQPTETAGALHDRLAVLGAGALLDVLAGIADASAVARPQPTEGVVYARKIAKSEARIDWMQSAVAIERRVRAFNPVPVAETLWNGVQLKIWRACMRPDLGADTFVPGAVLPLPPPDVAVATGEGVLQLLELQAAGRRPVTAADFVRAHAFSGVVFE